MFGAELGVADTKRMHRAYFQKNMSSERGILDRLKSSWREHRRPALTMLLGNRFAGRSASDYQ